MPPIDSFSFWLGFAVATSIGLILFWQRQRLYAARDAVTQQLGQLRERLTSGTERNWRDDVLRYSQTSHLAGQLFTLDEVWVPTRFFIPELEIDPNRAVEDEDLNAIIPVFYDWPEMAATYRAPTVSIEEAVSGDAPLVFIGNLGNGKSTLLAHLASRAARSDEKLFPGNPMPIFIHVADLELLLKPNEDVSAPLIAAAQMRASAITAAALGRFLRGKFQNGHCLILLDGFDDVQAAQMETIVGWLAQFKQKYPAHRLLAAAGLKGYGPLTQLGFAPVHVAPPAQNDYATLLTKWQAAWQTLRNKNRKLNAPTEPDLHLLTGWLRLNYQGRSVFELTHRIWATLAGDGRGPRPANWLEAGLTRLNLKPNERLALNKIGLALLNTEDAAGLPKAILKDICTPAFRNATGEIELDPNAYLDNLVSKRLLVKQGRDRLTFRHSLYTAYCAASGLVTEPENIKPAMTPLWNWTLNFLASLGDVTLTVKDRLSQPADVLQSEPLTCAQWLRDAPANVPWRVDVLRHLSRITLDPAQPETLRLRALAGFIAAHDNSAAALFKQASNNQADPLARRIGILGLGVLGDETVVNGLAAYLTDPYLDVRWAAALALANIGTENAIVMLQRGLQGGDDVVRQACAQAMARHPDLGHEFLKDALSSKDIAQRRAAVFGIAETRADWAMESLEKSSREEREWIVRNAASMFVTRFTEGGTAKPKPYVAPELQGWLLQWAASRGIGVPPGKGAVEVLERALVEGEEPTRVAATEALAQLADVAAARPLYTALADPESGLVRDAAYKALSKISTASGQRLYPPVMQRVATGPSGATGTLNQPTARPTPSTGTLQSKELRR